MTKPEVSEETKLALLQQDIGFIKATLDSVSKKMDLLSDQFVTKSEFMPIRAVVYGMVGLILSSVILGVLALVLYRP